MNNNEFKLTTLNKIIIGIIDISLIPSWIIAIQLDLLHNFWVVILNILAIIMVIIEIPWFINLKKKQ